MRPLDRGHPLGAVVGGLDVGAQHAEHLGGDDAVGRIVLDDQHPEAGQPAVVRRLVLLGRCGHRGGDVDPETGPLALGAAEADVAAHQLGDPAGHREAQAGAAETPGRGIVPLAEQGEQLGLRLLGDADAGVAHRQPQPARLAFTVGGQLHLDPAIGGELHGVADQVEEHLAQAGRVGADPADVLDRDA